MKRISTGILFFLFAIQLQAIPFFPCDSVFVTTVNPNQPMQRIEVTVLNTSISTFNTPYMSGVLNANPYITIGTVPGQAAVLNYNGGYTGFALNCTSFAQASAVPTGTIFTGTVTLYNPNDLSASCDYTISFTYGTGPVGIAVFSQLHETKSYPNPASDFILLGSEQQNQNTNWFIYDCTGNLILTSRSNRIDLSAFSSGLYFFRNEESCGRFIKAD